MKPLLLFTTFFLLATSLVPAAESEQDFFGSRISRFEGSFYDFRLTKTRLHQSPRWDPASKFPPLSPREAATIATTQLPTIVPSQFKEMSLLSITLENLSDSDWIYLVTFDYNPHTAYSGPARELTIPVYMDGTTITSAIRLAAPPRPSSR